MGKYELKTKPTDSSVVDFLNDVEDEQKREDCFAILDLMMEITGEEPRIWSGGTIGFGSYQYKGKSGSEGEWYITGFSPRKQNITIYIMAGFDRYTEYMSELGKYKTGKSCLYINKLADIDSKLLKKIAAHSAGMMRDKDSEVWKHYGVVKLN